MQRIFISCFIFVAMLTAPFGAVSAHAFSEKSTPSAGATLHIPPKTVTVRFDRTIEPVFSTLRVKNEADARMDTDDSHVINSEHDTLTVTLKPLINGRYHVLWIAVARDGHRTHGDYWFAVHQP